MRRFVLLRRVLLLCVFCLALGAQTFAAENIYMTIVGPQGAIRGEAKSPHGSEWIAVMSFEPPRDVATGQASGKRQHEPVKVTKIIDAASPKLEKAMLSGEHLKEVVFQVYRTGAGGREELYETIRLTNAMISSFRKGVAAEKSGEPQEELTFSYEKIESTYTQQKQTPTLLKGEPVARPSPPSARPR